MKESTIKNRYQNWKFFAITLLILINIININNPILEQHSFRQTQTAISIFYLIKDGFTLNYITPVVGQSYTIPFEFPIFHFIVGFFSKYVGISLDVSGRLVSLVFAIGALIVNDLLLREIGIDRRARLFSLLLIVCAPIFLFWSGTFMIESAALFFSIFSLLLVIKYARSPKNLYLFLWLLVSTLALLQKVTTSLLPYMLGSLVVLYAQFKTRQNQGSIIPNITKFSLILLLISLPIAIAYLWVIYTDILKSGNPIALVKMTSIALTEWNYGTLAQRFSQSFWIANVYVRAVAPLMLLGFALVAIAFCFWDRSIKKHIKIIISVFLGLYLVPQLVFTNLFIVHDYYHYAVIIYLCNAIGITYSYVNIGHNLKKAPYYFLLATCICSLFFFAREYRHAKFSRIDDSYITLAVAREIKSQTVQEDNFVIFGYDWSSEVAYYSERKSLAVPEWYLSRLKTRHLESYFGKVPKLVVICNNVNHKYDQFFPQFEDYILQQEMLGCTFFKHRN